jgi:hypothetical protein
MANTSYLRREVERYVRQQLEKEFSQPFTAEFLAIAPGGKHEFDAVAADRNVIASIKSASGLTAGGNIPNGKINDCLAELYYLSLTQAPIRRLVLTTPSFFEIFKKRTVGAVAPGIDIVCVPLPANIQAEVDRVVREASREVTPAAAAAAVATEVESELDSRDTLA